MPKAQEPVTADDIAHLLSDDEIYPAPAFEPKPENIGIVNGVVLVLDYRIDDAEEIKTQREYFEQRGPQYGNA